MCKKRFGQLRGDRLSREKPPKQVTHPCGESRPRQVCTVRPGKLRDGRAKSIVPSSSGVTSADEIAMSEENDSVLGNLPRSRPGVRSDKRANSKQAPRAKPSTKARTKAAAKPRTAPRKPSAEQPPPPPATSPGDPNRGGPQGRRDRGSDRHQGGRQGGGRSAAPPSSAVTRGAAKAH